MQTQRSRRDLSNTWYVTDGQQLAGCGFGILQLILEPVMDVYDHRNVSSIIAEMPEHMAVSYATEDVTGCVLKMRMCAIIYYCSGNIYCFGGCVVLFQEITICMCVCVSVCFKK